MISATWKTIKDVVLSFISDEALTRGAAIAFYTATSIAPVLLIVIAIAGLVFGQEAAQNAITSQFSDLMGHQTAEVLQSASGHAKIVDPCPLSGVKPTRPLYCEMSANDP
jgi:membrane protein